MNILINFIVSFLFILSAFSASAKPVTISIEDTDLKLQEYHWACKANRLALVLTSGKREAYSKYYSSYIYILDPETKTFTHKIHLPQMFNPAQVAWLRDDSGFFLLIDHNNTQYNIIFEYRISDQSFRESAYNGTSVYDMTFDRKTDYWAANIAEEGHKGVSIYKADKFVLSFCRSPESEIYAFAWNNGKLLCESDVMLDDELGCGSNAYSVNYEQGTRKNDAEIFTFEIDPVKKKAEKVKDGSINVKDILNTSSDGKYYVRFETPEKGNVVIKLY